MYKTEDGVALDTSLAADLFLKACDAGIAMSHTP
jgi:hypothetical protein